MKLLGIIADLLSKGFLFEFDIQFRLGRAGLPDGKIDIDTAEDWENLQPTRLPPQKI